MDADQAAFAACREVRRLRRLGVILVLGNILALMLGGFAIGSGRLWTAGCFAARKFRLIDEQGRVIAGMLFDPRHGGANIYVRSPDQAREVGLMCCADGLIGLLSRCRNARGGLQFTIESDGRPSFGLHDGQGRWRIAAELGEKGQPRIDLSNSDGWQLLTLGVPDEEGSDILLRRPDGTVRAVLGRHNGADGFWLTDEENRVRAGLSRSSAAGTNLELGVSGTPGPFLHLSVGNGKHDGMRLWSAGGDLEATWPPSGSGYNIPIGFPGPLMSLEEFLAKYPPAKGEGP